ncbi:hypothetical protein BDR26DRAFT_1002788 [Obelidium mucronatum]|nr:hypothetical protein BDR26DRAFT_1002788 [Obelidium mucronatum]
MNSDSVANLASAVSCAAVLILYHIWLVWTVRNHPEKTVFGVMARGRKTWVKVMMKGKKDILAIQTLRNLIMVSSILASTSVVLIFGFITFLNSVTINHNSASSSTSYGFVLDGLFNAKVMVLCLVLCFSFFCFAQAMRFYNHVGMTINMGFDENSCSENNYNNNNSNNNNMHHQDIEKILLSETTSIDFAAEMLNRGSLYQTAGLRGYYLTFPILGFLWGPWSLIGSTVVLVLILRIVDFNLEKLSLVPVLQVSSSTDGNLNTGTGFLQSTTKETTVLIE